MSIDCEGVLVLVGKLVKMILTIHCFFLRGSKINDNM